MTLKNRSVLITGGAGFIGSHLAEALVRAGADVTIVDNLNNFYSPEVKFSNLAQLQGAGRFKFECLDITHHGALMGAFARARAAVVVHLAAYAGVRPSIEQPRLYSEVNLSGTVNVLEACRQHGVPKLVFGSSSSVYGATSRAPFSEEQAALRPISPYAATKLGGELLAYTYAHLHGLSVNCLRFFTVYGPRQRPDLAIHKFTALMEAGKPAPVFGDGSSGRDYTFVDDIVSGILAAMEYEAPERFEVFNLGNSHPVTLNELLETLESVARRKIVRLPQPDQPGDVPLTWADISKARRLLGYQPTTSLHEGLEKFVAWYRSGRAQPTSRAMQQAA